MRSAFLAFCLLVACDRQGSPPPAVDGSPPTAAEDVVSGCGALAPEQLRFPVTPGDHNTECGDPSARHYWLRVRSPEGMHFWAASVIALPYNEQHGLSLYGLGVAGSSRIEPESPVGRWLACEAQAGHRPAVEVEICAPSDRAAGFSVLTVFEPGHRQVAFVGNNPEQQSQVLELRGVDGAILPLEPVSFERRGMEGTTNTIQAFHVPGTPMFSASEGGDGILTFGARPSRHRRRH